MQSIVFVNPLKPGKLKEYKAFAAEITGPGKKEYYDMMKRYGLLTTKVYYHNLVGREFVIVFHDAEKDATERLKKFTTSNHPYDRWFMEQLNSLHDFDLEVAQTQLIFACDTRKS